MAKTLGPSQAVEVVIIGHGKNYHDEFQTTPQQLDGYYERKTLDPVLDKLILDPSDITKYEIDSRKMFKVYNGYFDRRKDKKKGVLDRYMIVFLQGDTKAKDLDEKTVLQFNDSEGNPKEMEITSEMMYNVRYTSVIKKYLNKAFSEAFSGKRILVIGILVSVAVVAIMVATGIIRLPRF